MTSLPLLFFAGLPGKTRVSGIPAVPPPPPAHRCYSGRRSVSGGDSAAVCRSAGVWKGGEGEASELQLQRPHYFASKSSRSTLRRGRLRIPAVVPSIPTVDATRPAAASLALLDHCPSLSLGSLRGRRGMGGFQSIPRHELPRCFSHMHGSCCVGVL